MPGGCASHVSHVCPICAHDALDTIVNCSEKVRARRSCICLTIDATSGVSAIGARDGLWIGLQPARIALSDACYRLTFAGSAIASPLLKLVLIAHRAVVVRRITCGVFTAGGPIRGRRCGRVKAACLFASFRLPVLIPHFIVVANCGLQGALTPSQTIAEARVCRPAIRAREIEF